MAMTPLPTPAPNLQNNTPEQFTQNVDALLGALPAFVNEANALEDNVNAKELSADNAAQVALESKLIAEASAQTASTKAQEASASAASALDSKNAVLNVEANQAIDVLNAIKTVDGSGSGLDADLLDGMQTGQSGTRYIVYANASGNVGIGKSNPGLMLDVGGTFSSTDYRKATITNETTSGASVNVGVTSPYMVFVSYYNKSTFASGHSLVTVSSGGVFQIAHNDGSGCGVSFTGNLISFTVKTTSGSVFATIRIIN
jgi:hypothetical protein